MKGLIATLFLPVLVVLQFSKRTRPWAQKQIEKMKSEEAK